MSILILLFAISNIIFGYTNDQVIKFEPDYAIGIGWCPYTEPIVGITTSKVNLRAEPSTKAEIIATLEKGTEVKVLGVSIASSIVMNENEWQLYIEKIYKDTEDTLGVALWKPTHWLLVKYNDELLWAHSIFVKPKDSDEHFMPDPLMMIVIPPGDVYEYIFDSEGNLIESKYSGEKKSDVVPFINIDWHYMERPYFSSQFEEPTYDLRHCSPPAFRLYQDNEEVKMSPRWLSYLPLSTIVADYIEDEDSVFVVDMAKAMVIKMNKEGRIISCSLPFALPLRICPDGEGGIWVSDPYVWRIVHFNKEGKPIGIIEKVKALDITFNEKTGDLWVYGVFLDNKDYNGYIIIYDKYGILKRKTFISIYSIWCDIEMIDDTRVSLLLWEGEA